MHFSRLQKSTLLVASLACLPTPATALITVGSLDLSDQARASDVVVEDGLAYIGTLLGLVIADVSNPKVPVEIGAFELPRYTRSIIVDVAVDGELAFLAAHRLSLDSDLPAPGSLRIIDVSDPTAPVEIGAFEVSQWANGIAVVDGLAYLTAWTPPDPRLPPEIKPANLHVIDVSNPTTPIQVGNIEITGVVSEIEVLGNSAYILDYDGFHVIDLSNPAAPVEIGEARTGGRAYALTTVNGSTYVAGRSGLGGSLTIFDVSDPTAPTEAGYVELPEASFDVAIKGKTAYTAGLNAGLQAIDVSDPMAPVTLGNLTPPNGSIPSLAVADGLAYVLSQSDFGSGLHIINLSIPTTPIEVGTTTVSGAAVIPDVAVAGDLAYVTAGETGVRLIDVSNPAVPVQIGEIDTPDYAGGVTAMSGSVYVADGDSGLRIIDVSNPTAPVEIGSIDTPGWATSVEVTRGLAYLADGSSGLRVIDVSNPEEPVEVGAVDTPDYAVDLTLSGRLAYVSDRSAGLRIIDISTPEAPTEIGALETPDQSRGIAVSNGLVYLTASTAGLRVIDVSNPRLPTELGALDRNLRVYDVAVEGKIAYLAGRQTRAIDVSDPTAPWETGGIKPPIPYAQIRAVTVANGFVYTVRLLPPSDNVKMALDIVDFGPEYATKIEVAIEIAANINPASRGVIPVAILGSEGFDIANIDPTTLTFGPGGAAPAHRSGGHPEDVDGDGTTDLVSHFWVRDAGLTSETERVCVSGTLRDGTAFEGCGAIRSLP